MRTRHALVVPALLLAGAACTGDDDDAQADDPPGGGDITEATCDAYVAFGTALATGEDLTQAKAELVNELPGSLQKAASTLDDPEAGEASTTVGDALFDACEVDTKRDITGVEWGFGGAPSQVDGGRLDAGRVAFRFTNLTDIEEAHEMQLLRDGTLVGIAYAARRGVSATLIVDLDPGGYTLTCDLPVTDDPSTTHAHKGMVEEFEVVT